MTVAAASGAIPALNRLEERLMNAVDTEYGSRRRWIAAGVCLLVFVGLWVALPARANLPRDE